MADADKKQFVIQCRQTASLFGRVLREMREQAKVWADRGYEAGGAPGDLVDADLDGDTQTENVTIADITAYINACTQFGVWVGTGVPSTESVVNRIRNDI